jgi:hypothetical protein
MNYRFSFMKPLGEAVGTNCHLGCEQRYQASRHQYFSIFECQSAIEYPESGRARGKIVISVID